MKKKIYILDNMMNIDLNNTNSLWNNNETNVFTQKKFNNSLWNNKKPSINSIMINNQTFIISKKQQDYNNLYYSILSQINNSNIQKSIVLLRETIANNIYQKCINNLNYKYYVYYHINTQWKDKWINKFPQINNVKGDDLITSYLNILKTPNSIYKELAYGGILEIEMIALLLNVKIGLISNKKLKFYNKNNKNKTIYIYENNNNYEVAKLNTQLFF